MNKKDLVRQEKDRLQKYFDQFNEKGSTLAIQMKGDKSPMVLGVYDSYEVTRVVPFVDKDGKITRTVFWLFFKSMGYDSGSQYCHTKKMVKLHQEDTYELDLEDDGEIKYHIELIFPELEPDLAMMWAEWKEYKKERHAWFAEADPQIRDWHLKAAREGTP